mgnify:CR=1 FL=1
MTGPEPPQQRKLLRDEAQRLLREDASLTDATAAMASALGIAAKRRAASLLLVGRTAVDFLAHGRSASGDDSQRPRAPFDHRPRLS